MIDAAPTFPFIALLGEAGRCALAALPTRRAAAATQLLQRGDAVDGMFLVSQGVLRVYHISAEGREVTLYRVEPGQTCILALTAAYRREPYPAWVESGPAGARFVVVPHAQLHALLAAEEALRAFVFEALSGRVFELMARLAEASVERVEARLVALLLRRADAAGTVVMTQAQLAAELGTAREVVFRALRELAQARLVRTGRGHVQVLERARLEARLH